MAKMLPILMLCALWTPAAFAAEPTAPSAPASAASLRELLTVTGSRSLMEDAQRHMDTVIKQSMQQAQGGENLNDAQKKIIEDMQAEMKSAMKEALDWDSIEPMMIEIYAATYTQREVDDMLAFYRTDTGRSMIAKMPVVMQKTMTTMQRRMVDLFPRIRKLQSDTAAKIAAARSSPAS